MALDVEKVRYWDLDGGTHLGSSRTNPFNHKIDGQRVDASDQVMRNFEQLELDALVPIGGEDTLGVAARLAQKGAPVVGIPKTIDKDLGGTDYTLGFDTSLRTCVDIIERSRTPAGSHHWVQVVEVMGRHAGHLALWSGLAGGAYITLIPEAPFELDKVLKLLDERLSAGQQGSAAAALRGRRRRRRRAAVGRRRGHRRAEGGRVRARAAWRHRRVDLAEQIRQKTKWDSRAVALGHPQRGGTPSPVDRIMGHLFGSAAVEACLKGTWGKMVSARGIAPACQISLVSLEEATKGLNLVDVKRHYNIGALPGVAQRARLGVD